MQTARRTANEMFRPTQRHDVARFANPDPPEPKTLPIEAARSQLEQSLEVHAGEGLSGWLRRTKADRAKAEAHSVVVTRAIERMVEIEMLDIDLTTERVKQDLKDIFAESSVASCSRQLQLKGMYKLEVEATLVSIEGTVVKDRRAGADCILSWHEAGDITDDERDEHLTRIANRYRGIAEQIRQSADDMIKRINHVLQASE